jgi:putative transposase
MPRFPRLIVPEIPHHIIHRGNNKNQVFFNPDDFRLYLDLLENYSEKYHFDIIGYCLMTNHVHLVGIPSSVDSLINVIRDTHQKYSLLLNKKLNRCGHTWQERACVCACDDHHAVASTCYSEFNPVSAYMVLRPEDYRWSSARAHLGLEKWPSLLDSKWWKLSFTFSDWIDVLEAYDHRMDSIIREATVKGLPLGNKEFITMVENYYGVIPPRSRKGRPVRSNTSPIIPVNSEDPILQAQFLH